MSKLKMPAYDEDESTNGSTPNGSSTKAGTSSDDKARSRFFSCFTSPKSPRPSSVGKTRDQVPRSDAPGALNLSGVDPSLGTGTKAGPSSVEKAALSDTHGTLDLSGATVRSSTVAVNVTPEDGVLGTLNPTSEDGIQELKLKTVIADLKDSVVKLNEAINTKFTKDPLEPLYKEREELTKFVLAIGGLTTVASFSSPPGGLDANGFIRFRHTPSYLVYLVVSNLSFVLTCINLAQLYRPVEEEDTNKAKTLKRRLLYGWTLFWSVMALFFAAF